MVKHVLEISRCQQSQVSTLGPSKGLLLKLPGTTEVGADLSGLAVPMIPSSDCYEHTMLGSLCRLLELDHQCPRRFQGPRRFQETWFLTDEANGTNTLNSFPLENIYTWLPPGLEILRLMAILSEVRLQRSPEPSRAYKPGLMAKSLPWSGIFCYLES